MSLQVFTLPDLGEGLAEAELVRWLVAVGDTISVDQAVVEVETAKAVVEVPSPFGGVVARLHGDAGGVLNVGEPLISIQDDAHTELEPPTSARQAEAPAVTAATPPAAAAAAAAESYREEERAGSGNVLIGYGTSDAPAVGRGRRGRRRTGGDTLLPQAAASRLTPGPAAVRSPLVRELARQHGVDLRALTGTGPAGLITRGDVERAATPASAPSVPPAAQPVAEANLAAGDASPAAPEDHDSRTGLSVSKRVAVQGLRKAVTRTLTRSRQEIPEATTWVDVDATALLELRASLGTPDRRGPGLLALIARLVVAGLARFPELNARVDDEAEQILHLGGVNLGIAAQTERGLVVPSVRNAHLLTARGLDDEIRRLTAAARAGEATAAELSSGSFTLNNYGNLGVDGSAAIINHPEVAILGIGRVIPRPWVVDGQIVVRQLTQMSLVFDHRVCDGGTAGGFLRFVADAVESPISAFADL